MYQVSEFFQKLLGTESWPARWHCGRWTEFHGWLYIISDLAVWAAYFTIPLLLFYFIKLKPNTPFPKIFWLFGAFILLCGATHLIDAAAFWWPAYRFNALIRFCTAVASWATVIALVRILPRAVLLRSSTELEQEINERKRAEEQLEAINKELETFSYSVSHDLRAPLRAIDGYSKMLEQDYNKLFDEEGKRLLETIQESSKKMGNLIDDLLAFSKLGKKALVKTNVDMNELINEVLVDIDKTTKHKAEIKVSKLHPANGDHGLISQVIVNLISNAIKYSSKKMNPLVEITSQKKNEEVIYIVKDNGEGFDMAYADKLFGVFQRLHTQEEFEGTGVGLAIVQRIVSKHGGKVWAEAELGTGATFSFTLPTK